MEKEKFEQFIEDLELEIAESFHEQQRISRHIFSELQNVNTTMASKVDAIKKIEWLEASIQNLVRYKNQYMQEQQRIDWNQNMYNKMKGGDNE